MKITRISSQQFDDYVKNTDYCTYLQTSSYGHLSSRFGFKEEYFGFEENGNLVGACLLLSKQVFMGFKFGYSPRGIIINYNDSKLINEAVKTLKKRLLKEQFLVLKIDPPINQIKDKTGKIIEPNDNFEKAINILKSTGFNHYGYNLEFETINPRWEAEVDLRKESQVLFKELNKQVKNKLRKAIKYGLVVYKDNKNDFEQFFHLIKDKDNKTLKYYQYMNEYFKDNLEIYYAKLDTEAYVKNSKKLYEKELEMNNYLSSIIQSNGYKGKSPSDILNKKMESDKVLNNFKKHMVDATELLKEYPTGVIVGATVIIKNKNKIYLVVEGFEEKYKNMASTYLTKWKIIEKYANSEIDFFNLNAITGNFSKTNNQYKGLNEMKLNYNSKIIEYIGEFELIINKPIYSIYKKLVPKK